MNSIFSVLGLDMRTRLRDLSCMAIWLVLGLWGGASACPAQQVSFQMERPVTAQAVVNGKKQTGWPLVSDGSNYVMLRRDGSLKTLSHGSTSSMRLVSDSFRPYSVTKYVNRLQEVFGPQYEVSQTQHFVVVHPRGRRQKWVPPFERLYSTFTEYFAVRRVQVGSPQFPLIAVVFRTRQEYDEYVRDHDGPSSRNIVGLYFQNSNRIVTYDQSAGSNGRPSENLATVIHEATHQVAFNTGVQSRFAPPPVWTAEGIAMMFESMGIAGPTALTRWSSRINPQRLQHARIMIEAQTLDASLRQIIADDQLFRTAPDEAYTAAWALTFYLAENRPGQFSQYLSHLARREPFTVYSQEDKLRDFARFFGSNLDNLVLELQTYYRNQR